MSNGNGNGKVERLAQSAVFTVAGRAAMLLVLPAILYMANAQVEIGKTLIVIQSDNAASKQITDARIEALRGIIESQMTDRYRGTDAIRDQRVMQLQIDELKRRTDVLERQVPGTAVPRGRN